MSNYNVGDIILCNPSKNLRDGLFNNTENRNIKVVVTELRVKGVNSEGADYRVRPLEPNSNLIRDYGGSLTRWWVHKDCLSPCRITDVSQMDIDP